MIVGANPWLSMWTHPRMTIRGILHLNARYGFWVLATVYAAAMLFYAADFYSWKQSASFHTFFIPLLLLAPLSGAIWFYFDACVLRIIGLLLGGKAPFLHVRAALVWSRVPFLISLIMWLLLFYTQPDETVIFSRGPSAVFVHLIILMLNLWALILLIQSIREVQSFSLSRAIANVFIAGLFSFLIIITFMFVVRYIYLLIR